MAYVSGSHGGWYNCLTKEYHRAFKDHPADCPGCLDMVAWVEGIIDRWQTKKR